MSDAQDPSTLDRAELDRWVAEGRYAEAAIALRARGELALAQELFERTWDYPSALAIARERGDLAAQVRLGLLSGELDALHQLLPAARAAPHSVRQTIAATLAEHGQPALAAELYEAAGELVAAQRLYQQASRHLDCGRLQEREGDLRAGALSYQRSLEQASDDDWAQKAQAHLALGRVLQALGQPEEAVLQLQQARAQLRELAADQIDATTLDEVELALVRGLCALGHTLIAHPILLSYIGRHSDEPAAQTVAEFVARHSARATPAADAASEAAPVVLLGRYQLTRLLGSGGMGRVYLAEDRLTSRSVALKLLPARGAAGEPSPARPGSPADMWSRFVREAQLLRALRHPGIGQLLDFHPEAGIQVMEYLPGGSLAQRPLPLSPAVVRRVLLDVLAGLAAAHAAGVLHGDIKPHNLLVSATGDIRLSDFGAAHLQGLGATRTESFVGTFAYMAPEQLTGQPLSFATDLYALAVTAFQLLTGRLPFPGPDFIAQHVRHPPPDPRHYLAELAADFAAVLTRALQKAPERRYESVEQMRSAVLALVIEEAEESTAPGAAGQETVPPARPAPPRADLGITLEGASPILQTCYSTVALALDLRLGRPVLVERFDTGRVDAAAYSAHLRWLRGLARLAGPGLQRVLRIDEAAAQVHYEVPIGPHASRELPLTGQAGALLRRTLLRLHAAGLVHGAVRASVVCEQAAALLLVHGRGPLGWPAGEPPSAEQDLAQLAELLGKG